VLQTLLPISLRSLYQSFRLVKIVLCYVSGRYVIFKELILYYKCYINSAVYFTSVYLFHSYTRNYLVSLVLYSPSIHFVKFGPRMLQRQGQILF